MYEATSIIMAKPPSSLQYRACTCRMISQMRRWVDTRGGGGPFPSAGPPPSLSKEEAIDRLHQHTLNCPSCSAVSQCSWPLLITTLLSNPRCTSSACTPCCMNVAHPQKILCALCQSCISRMTTHLHTTQACFTVLCSLQCQLCPPRLILTCPLRAAQAYRNFRILRVVLAIAAGAFAATSMSTAFLGNGVSTRVPALFAAAALASGALAAVANNFVRLLTFKPYEHHKH